ncbi:MAG: putative filamentous hemagglutinin/adhesin [Phenylobacterium sp.]|nr:putative filamentous hemagglutinin/adhesin [Phenylobacterium sp.]
MRRSIALVAATALLAAAGAANAASVEIRDAVVRVTVIPEDRSDVRVEVLTTNRDLPLEVRTVGGETYVDGHLERRITGCHGKHDSYAASVRGVGRVAYADVPQLVIRTPRAVAVSSNGVVFGAVGRSASLDLRNSGCSSWTIADVAGDAAIEDSGAGSVSMGASGRLDLRLSGAGEIHATRIHQGLQASLSGVGNVTVEQVSGPVQARVSGVGKIRLADGHAGAVTASVSGMGSVELGGVADSLDASISGFGAIRVRQVTGAVSKSVTGGGHVTIGDRS